MSAFGSFLEELRRRHVYRVAIAYAAIGWLLAQVITQVLPVFEMPLAMQRLAVLIVIAGFPVALLVAWFYELGPSGLRRDTGEGTPRGRFRRMDFAILGLVVLSIAVTAVLWRTEAFGSKSAAVATVDAGAKSVAVLPFQNLSDDHANAYFAIGMQEQIRNQLTRLSGLKVVSSGSQGKYQSHPDDPRSIGQELGVGTLLEGSVQKSGDEARISLQLIDVATNTSIWAETYDRNLSHIFTVESEVAANVADALRVRLLPKERQQLAVAPTRNPQAYDALLRGEAAQQRAEVSWQKVDIDAAIAAFQEAVADDPQFALAYARLGYAYVWTTNFLTGIDVPTMLEHSRDAFGKALALNPDLPEAHVAAGFYHFWADGDDAAAAGQFKEALALNPQNAEAQLALGDVEQDLGHLDDAEIAIKRALTLDPRSVLAWQALAGVQWDKRQYAEADRSLLKAVAINPDAGLTWGMRDYDAYYATGEGTAQYAMILAAPPKVRANPTHLVDRAESLYHMHDYARALALFKTSKGSTYGATSLCGWQADTEWAMGDRVAATAEYQRCVGLILADAGHAKNAIASARLGWFYARLGRAQDAEREGLRAVALLPLAKSWDGGAFMLYYMAKIWAQLGRADKAVPILAELLDTDHGNAVSIATVRTAIEWDPIRNRPEFKQLLQRYANVHY